MSINEEEQLCGVDSDTGQISYYFNPNTGEVKWVDQPSEDMSKKIPAQLPNQTDTEDLSQSAKLGNLEDNVTPFPDDRKHVQTQIEPTDECSNMISEGLVTVVLEPCPDSVEKAESSSSVMMQSNREMPKYIWKQDSIDTGSHIGVTGNGRINNVSIKRKQEHLHSEKIIRSFQKQTDDVTMVSRAKQTGQEPASDNQPSLFTPDDNDIEDNEYEYEENNNTGDGTEDGERIQTPQPEILYLKECSKCFKKCSIVAIQLGAHSDEKPFLCEECEKCFRESQGLTYRIHTHSGEKTYQCKQCGTCLKSSDSLIKHVRIHTGEKPFKCNQCRKCFTTSSNLAYHVQTHSEDKPFKCEQCGKGFRKRSHLTDHMRTHSGEKPFKCKQCGKSFKYSNSLPRHVRANCGAGRSHTCKRCGKCFTTPFNLAYHVRTHSVEKPFKCEQCEKGFRKRSHLTDHMRTHSGDKPFKCEQCDKRFKYSNSLPRHIRTHSVDKPF